MSLKQSLAAVFGAATPAVNDQRWVVLDVESSGLDAARDRLLAIAALAVRLDQGRPAIDLGDSFEVVLKQSVTEIDKPNILIHGIGVGAQHQGLAPSLALEAFERFAGTSPLIAFHAAFDQRLVLRAFQSVLGRTLANPWLDLEPLAAVARPDIKAKSLDEWMAVLGIGCAVRHQAAADTMATAELMLKIWPHAIKQMGSSRFVAAQRLVAQRRWL